jgi:glycosyltransferase involved in cell wall biosynthesis
LNIRPAHILCLYPRLTVGGADKFNHDMLTSLASQGWRITIITTLPGPHPWRATFEHVCDDIIDLAFYPPQQYPARLLDIISTRSVTCVLISNSALGYHLLPYLRARLPDLTFVDYCHMVEPGRPNGGYPGMSLDRAHLLDLQIVSSEHLKQWMCERGGEADRIAVCTTNIDTIEWEPRPSDRQALRSALGIPITAPVVLYAARLERQKQPMLTLSIMKRVAAQLPTANFLVAGDGKFASYMRGFLRWHGLEQRVRMLGTVSNQRIRELLALSDVFFLPSEMEGISLAIYEAMAMGVVPVGAAVGGQAELVTPECGILVAPGRLERESYSLALLCLLREPTLARQMGQAARQRVTTHFGIDRMGTRINQLLIRAQEFHQWRPRPTVEAKAARAAARGAVITARGDAAKQRQNGPTGSLARQLLRKLFWHLVDSGAWWLAPIAERTRRICKLLFERPAVVQFIELGRSYARSLRSEQWQR